MKIFGLEIGKYRYREFLHEITDFLHDTSEEKGRVIFTPNPEICLKTLEDQEFLEVLEKADYLTSDGIGLYLAYQIQDFLSLGKREYPKGEGLFRIVAVLLLPYFLYNILFRKKYVYKKYGERICGSDITTSLVEYVQRQKIKIAIIDPYYPDDREKCIAQEGFSDILSQKFPHLDFDFYIYSEDTSNEIFDKISDSNAKILFSTLGMKRQEISVLKGLSICPNLKLGLGIGSAFDYYTGFQKRAPKIFRSLGFEWLYRIFTSPNKLKRIGRIYKALIVFPIKVLLYK